MAARSASNLSTPFRRPAPTSTSTNSTTTSVRCSELSARSSDSGTFILPNTGKLQTSRLIPSRHRARNPGRESLGEPTLELPLVHAAPGSPPQLGRGQGRFSAKCFKLLYFTRFVFASLILCKDFQRIWHCAKGGEPLNRNIQQLCDTQNVCLPFLDEQTKPFP